MSEGAGAPRERFFELSANLLAIAGPDGRLVDVNPAWEQTLGSGTGRLLADLAHPEDRADVESVWARAGEQTPGEPTVWSVDRFGGGAGDELWLSWSLTRPAGDETHFHVMARDVSETGGDVAGGRAIAAWDRLVALVENSRDFIGVATLEGRVYFVNAFGRELVGLPAEGAVPDAGRGLRARRPGANAPGRRSHPRISLTGLDADGAIEETAGEAGFSRSDLMRRGAVGGFGLLAGSGLMAGLPSSTTTTDTGGTRRSRRPPSRWRTPASARTSARPGS